MNKFEYDNIITEIKILELKLKKISFAKDLLELKKPYFFNINKRKKWKNKIESLIIQEENITKHLLLEYEMLEKLFT